MAHGKSPVYKTVLGGLAVKGYDPVAYFDAGKPVKGDKKFVHEHKGAKWRFSSQKNLDAFKADTAKYEPQYGGYCAWAVSQGYTAKIDPEAWKIVDGKLYLNYSRKIQAKWEKDVPGFIKKADENWPGVLK
ncbi:MAG: YHS domain-containing (seleno)protein [Verrucomicrobiota bacterium]